MLIFQHKSTLDGMHKTSYSAKIHILGQRVPHGMSCHKNEKKIMPPVPIFYQPATGSTGIFLRPYCAAWLIVIFLVQVLDEIYCILKSVRVSPNPPRAHELLQELRDLSSMAMEHFDEKIAPNLRDQMPESSALSIILSRNSSIGRNSSPSFGFRGVHSRTL